MAVGDNAADSAPVGVGAVFLGSMAVSFWIGVGGTTKDEEVVVDVVAGAVLLILVGTDDARIVAVGETGTG